MGLKHRHGRLAVRVFAVIMVIAPAAGPAGHQLPSWTPIFNGRDLSGWEHVGPGRFVVEQGVLRTEGGMGLLWYAREPLRNVAVRVEYRNPGGVNSGVFVRIPERPLDPWRLVFPNAGAGEAIPA
jgi:hypothetical protein